ncbi:hypothetical protein BH10ACI3_BH10ACI3_19800 [soil metagenome]
MNNWTIIKVCLSLFVVSFGVRLLVWQNNKIAMAEVQSTIVELYQEDAAALVRGDVSIFLAGRNPPSDATILTHPPGYSLLMAPIIWLFGSDQSFLIFQLLLNSLSPVVIFLIALNLFDRVTGIVAGMLTAVAPQFAYYSGVLLPDGLCVLPILFAVYAIVLATKNQSYRWAVVCGASLGVSCWLRSNAMVMPLIFAAFSLILVPKQIRIRFALTILAAFILTIAPVTIRNSLVFRTFIPLSLGMGHMVVIGIGDYDKEGRFGLPRTDEGDMELDAKRDGRSDYDGLYTPNGIQRERDRLMLGLNVIKDNPFWYVRSVLYRSVNMLRMERVPVIAPERDERATTNKLLYDLNIPLKYIQRLFITAFIIPLSFVGLFVLFRDRSQRKAIMILAVVPVYYLCVQSLIYTEYRFIIAMSYFFMIFSSVAICFAIRKAGLLKEIKTAA